MAGKSPKTVKRVQPAAINGRERSKLAALTDKIQRERAKDKVLDRAGEWSAKCCALASEVGAKAADVIDEWHYRAAIMQYDAGLSDAESRAFDDVCAFYRRRVA